MIDESKYIPEPNSGCFIWMGAIQSSGYGNTNRGLAHRVQMGSPKGLQVRHMCGNRLCVNPTHLELGTQSDNEADKWRHGTANYYASYGKRGTNGRLLPLEER